MEEEEERRQLPRGHSRVGEGLQPTASGPVVLGAEAAFLHRLPSLSERVLSSAVPVRGFFFPPDVITTTAVGLAASMV